MMMFKDRNDRYVFLRPEDVSAMQDGGNQFVKVYLRGGQTIAIAGSVDELWQALSRQANLNKEQPS